MAITTPLVIPSTPSGRDTVPARDTAPTSDTAPTNDTAPTSYTAPAIPLTPTSTRAVLPTISPLTASVPEDVAKIYGIPDNYADALTTALSIVYEVDDRVSVTVDTILQKLFYTVTS